TVGTGIQEIRDLMLTFNHAATAVRQSQGDLQRAYVDFVSSLANALDARDPYTSGHSRRVSAAARDVAVAMELTAAECETIRIGALLHDIGKIGVADHVLQKPGRLTEEEFRMIQQHPEIGRRIIEGIQGFEAYVPIVELHHENWDGTGYPRGLSGTEVPLGARIVHVVDAYDAMTSDRPYRPGMASGRALEILKECAGTQFDAEVVAIFAALRTGDERSDTLANLAKAVGVSTGHPETAAVEKSLV
ncbi:MAG: HD-GYP domain-containing protein, partial [Acidobacteriaceae bacterium]|nr:HD-GYP domain-containing protein [Acidobacteriaceae bacterium]